MSFKLIVDFNDIGLDPDDSAQDISAYVEQINSRRGFGAYKLIEDEPELTVRLRNTDRRFSPEYSAGAYYGKLRANKKCQLLFDDVPLWTGFTHLWQPSPLLYGRQDCRLVCRGLTWLLKATTLAQQLYINETADVIIADAIAQTAVTLTGTPLWVLGTAGYGELGETTYIRSSTTIGDFQTGESIIPLFGFNTAERTADQGTPAMTIIKDALEHERGRLWTAADGDITFVSRNAWNGNPAADWTADNDFDDIAYFGGIEELKNAVVVTGYQSIDGDDSGAVLYRLTAPVRLNAGDRRTIEVYMKDDAGNVVASDNVQPVTGSDLAWDGDAGNVRVGNRGQVLFIDISNPNDAPTTLTTLTIRGRRIASDSFKVESVDNSSIADFQRQELNINIKSMRDVSEAQGVAVFELDRRTEVASGRMDDIVYQRGFDELTSSDNLITSDIGTVIQVSEDQTGHNRKYRVVRVAYDISVERQSCRVRYGLEPAYTGTIWTIGTSLLGTNTTIGY